MMHKLDLHKISDFDFPQFLNSLIEEFQNYILVLVFGQ